MASITTCRIYTRRRRNGEGPKLRRWDREVVLMVLILHMYTELKLKVALDL